MCVALAAACSSAPALAKDKPKPSLSIGPVSARSLLAPVEEMRGMPVPAYRLDPIGEAASGQRARLSLEFGDATVFAITGRLERLPTTSGPLDASHARALGQRRDSGKVYGAGVSRKIGGVDLSATYQYSKISAEQPETDAERHDNGPGRSHSLRATARIRF
jgi:hypothetical protein